MHSKFSLSCLETTQSIQDIKGKFCMPYMSFLVQNSCGYYLNENPECTHLYRLRGNFNFYIRGVHRICYYQDIYVYACVLSIIINPAEFIFRVKLFDKNAYPLKI